MCLIAKDLMILFVKEIEFVKLLPQHFIVFCPSVATISLLNVLRLPAPWPDTPLSFLVEKNPEEIDLD